MPACWLFAGWSSNLIQTEQTPLLPFHNPYIKYWYMPLCEANRLQTTCLFEHLTPPTSALETASTAPKDAVADLEFLCPRNGIRGHLDFVLYVCLLYYSVAKKKIFNLRHNFWIVRDRDFIFGIHTQLMKPFQMTPRSMTLWPWLWPLY